MNPELLAILRLTTANVKILSADDGPARKVSPALALSLARSGAYTWGGSKHRVRWMRPIVAVLMDARPDMPVLPPGPEWMQRMGYEVFAA